MAEVVETRGLRDLQTALGRLERGVRTQFLADGVQAGGNVIRAGMQERAPRRPGSGFLMSHLEVAVTVAGGVGTAKVGPQRDAFYGGIIQQGAKPHRIEVFISARRKRRGGQPAKRVLSDGLRIFQSRGMPRGVVNHPGFAANPFMTDSLVSEGPRAIQVTGARIWERIDQQLANERKGQSTP